MEIREVSRNCKVNLRELGVYTGKVARALGRSPRETTVVFIEETVSVRKDLRNFQEYLGLDDG